MPLILAADTSTATNSVALCQGTNILAETVVAGGRLHSERLIPTIDWLLRESDMTLSDVALLAVSIGPGSFTGLRIGAATWKGLALANSLPLIGVPTLDAMTRLVATPPSGYLATVIDARMKEVFAAVYHFRGGVRTCVVEPCACSPDALIARIEGLPEFSPGTLGLIGDGATLYQERFQARWPEATIAPSSLAAPRASAVACEALALRATGVSEDGALVTPLYLRKSQAEINREKKLASP